MQSGARTPEVPSQALQEMGYNLAIYPSLPHKVAVAAMKTTYEYCSSTYRDRPAAALATSPEMHTLMGFEDVWDFEKSCADSRHRPPTRALRWQRRTLLDKIWDPHVVVPKADGRTCCSSTATCCTTGSFQAFARLRDKGLRVAGPNCPGHARSLRADRQPLDRGRD